MVTKPLTPAPKRAAVKAPKAAVKSVARSALVKAVVKAAPVAAKSVKSAKLAKPAKATKPAKVPKPAVPKVDKPKKPKLVRDGFTIPKAEYLVLDQLKSRAAALAHPIKKSELLRAGIKALAAMSDNAFLASLHAVPAIKTGRPKLPAAVAKP